MSEYLQKMVKAGYQLDQVTPIDVYSYAELVERLKSEPKTPMISTGNKDLDEIMSGGFEDGRLYILSAPTKNGKTVMAQTFMYNLARQGNASMIFSYEMGWQEIVTKFLEMDKSMGFPEATDLPLYLPIDLHRGGGELQYQWLFEAMAKAKLERNIKLAVIDHLHFLLPLKDFNNTSFLIGGIVREIKRMAVALKIPIILIAHITKVKDDKKPDISDIRDSSFIAQEADVVMMMYRVKNETVKKKVSDESTEDSYSNKSILSIEADRKRGKTGKVKLWHNGAMFEIYDEKKHGIQDFGQFIKQKFNEPNY
jgi:replicative DNA helicase